LNLGIVYKDKGDYPKAREEYLKASEVAKGWGMAIYYEGLLYEQAAQNCDFNFDTKLVYQLAVETYQKALSIDPSLSQARDRITALHGSVATKEDYFFRGYKAGQTIPISGKCYTWINRSITVPKL
jgi:tetratricopeptide (TPR) repeat protein